MWQILKEHSQDFSNTSSRITTWVLYSEKYNISVPLYIYLPIDAHKVEQAIFSIHGVDRNASKYRDIFINGLKNSNVLLVAPEFSDVKLHHTAALSLGNMYDSTRLTQENDRELWTFTLLQSLFEELRKIFTSLQYYDLFGHSAGAQFAHRYAFFGENKDVRKIVAANAGWYTMLDSRLTMPYGVKDILDEKRTREVLARRLIILAGEGDIEVDKNLRISRKANLQGSNRLERARNFYDTAIQLSKTMATPCNWEFEVLRTVTHSSTQAVKHALSHLLKS